MGIAQVGTATTGAYAPTSTANTPTGVASGDYLLALVYSDGSNVDPSMPAGWTKEASIANGSGPFTHYVYSKIAGGSEPGSYMWSGTSGNGVAVHVSAWRDSGGAYSTDPFDQLSTATGTGSATAASITPSVANSLVILSAINFGGALQTPPTGYTELSDADGLEWSYLVQTTAAATGTKATTGGGGAATAILFSVKPSTAGTGTAHALSGASAARPTMSAALVAEKPLSGAQGASPAFSGALAVERPLSGAVAATPTIRATLTVDSPVGATVIGLCATSTTPAQGSIALADRAANSVALTAVGSGLVSLTDSSIGRVSPTNAATGTATLTDQ